jgi:hypothetical protein
MSGNFFLILDANDATFLCAFANLIGCKHVPNSSLVDFRTPCFLVYHTVLSFSYLLFSAVDFCCILDSMLVWDL